MYKIYGYMSLLAFVTIGLTTSLQAQKQVTHQSQYWLRYYGTYNLSPDWNIALEFEDRRFFKNNRDGNNMLPRITLQRKLGAGWSAGIGFTYYRTINPADPAKPVAVTVPELRPHEDLSYNQQIKKLTISQRFRFEERWVHNSSSTELTDGYTYSTRFRYQFKLQYPIIQKETAAGSLNIKASNEIFLNIGHSIVQNTFDHNEAYIALNYGISKSFRAEFGYLNYFQEQKSGTQYYDRDVARFTLYHTLNFYKKH